MSDQGPAQSTPPQVGSNVGAGGSSKRRRVIIRGLRMAAAALLLLAVTPLIAGVIYLSPMVKPYSTLMLARTVTGQKVDRRWVALDEIAPRLIFSVMMSEDGKFCAHSGIDWEAVNTIVDQALGGEKTRGASTISMQTAKNLFLWHGRSYVRKALELPYALYLDLLWPKRRMMEIYLNVAEWGPGIFGVEAAAQHYFKRSAARISARQAALLAVTLPNPTGRNPTKPSRTMARMARVIEKRAIQSGAYVGCVR